MEQPKVDVGYLDQYAQIDMGITMKTFLKSAFLDLYVIEKKMNELYNQGTEDMSNLYHAAQYQEQLELLDFYLIDIRIEQFASG